MPSRATELDNRHDNKDKRAQCPICNPPKDRVPAWKVWRWALEHTGINPFKVERPS